jgi:hypothetical protein
MGRKKQATKALLCTYPLIQGSHHSGNHGKVRETNLGSWNHGKSWNFSLFLVNYWNFGYNRRKKIKF